jgi:SHS2 domain-containing protein
VSRGYSELEHTADVELEVWGPDMAALLEEAARGMYALMEIGLAEQPRRRRMLELAGSDREAMVVDFLGELLYIQESEGLAFDRIELEEHPGTLLAVLEGAPVRTQAREIKAVTFHRLEVRDSPKGLETRIVFDV